VECSARSLWEYSSSTKTACSGYMYRKTSNKRMDLETPAFNRDPAFTGDPASIGTLASSPLHLLMLFVLMFPVYVNFTLHMLILGVYIYLVS